ncbi:DEAD/DEAH box helicase [Massilia sp. W12]|uniref:DEAD/DEAH box helicase n=1 Tax=Massilia sp. W12 TaxID=3126507 RepID=UPI0030CAFA71
MYFTLDDVLANFDDNTYGKGAALVQKEAVRKVSLEKGYLLGVVAGSASRSYEQKISISADRHGGVKFKGECNCSAGRSCQHVVAALLEYLLQQEKAGGLAQSGLPNALVTWLQKLEVAARPKPPLALDPAQTAHSLLFVMAPAAGGKHVALALCKARVRPSGDVISASAISELFSLLSSPPPFMTPGDADLVRYFIAMRSGLDSQSGMATEPRGKIGAYLLRLLLEQQKLLWANSWADMSSGRVYPVKYAQQREAHLAWHDEEKGTRLVWQAVDPANPKSGAHPLDHILPTDPPWFIDNLSAGELLLQQGHLKIPNHELQALVAQAPLLALRDRGRLSQRLLASGLQNLVPMPEQVQQKIRDDIKFQPLLLLGSMSQEVEDQGNMRYTRWYDFGLIAFDYDGESVSLDPSQQVVRQRGDTMEVIQRDLQAESAAYGLLTSLGFTTPKDGASPLAKMVGVMQMKGQADWLRFAKGGLHVLEEAGWRVEKTANYRYDVVEIEDWYADVDNQQARTENAWFDLELGIVVNQKRIPLLPILVQMIRSAPHDFNPKTIASHDDDDQLLALLSNNVRVGLPWGRIKPILQILGELYFNEKVGSTIRLPKLDAARLAELEKALQMRWVGGDMLRELGQRLGEFGGMQKVAPPPGLRATLRDYQLDGVAWMQFMREAGLGGILADDMGLGKTIQTLTHILLEKDAGRLTAPALVVAPTSLMDNWQAEARRFAPSLKVLLLQGAARTERFDQISKYDLVLTTYALLPRDEEKLRQHEFHLMILDESHYIKNTRSKAAQTASVINARHRLCLTGTPLENHLGELWSQFNFLLPGFLGNEKNFNTEFRNPIEKGGDEVRRTVLSRRIRPFMLRRTKDKVAKELPPKTEMVRTVELTGGQRDLYETVRLAMDKKVRDEISKKGMARSQIVILEALLKLRQVCCDPRLVQAVSRGPMVSAKLVELMEMIEELLEEGRKILVFSQFTSMLQLIQNELQARAIDYALLTGDTKDRGAQVAAFQNGSVPIFLISLKAGGVGLNLTAADTVIHYDPWWNPAAENQATDRAWRIGQDKPVFVYKLIAKGTLEEKIQALQQRKSELAGAMMDEGEAHNMVVSDDDLDVIFAPLQELVDA